MKREQIFLSKNFTVIESDIPFTLKFNIKDNTANSAEDIINFKSGWYIFDNNKLLPQYIDGVYNLPKYNCWIEYDETLGTVPPHWYTCYINPKSVESLSSEVTELDPAQLAALRQDVQTNGGKVDAVKSSVDALQTSNHSDLGAVKSSVDALQVSNHSDLGAVKSSVDALQVSNHSDLGALGVLLTHDTEPGSVSSANLFDLLKNIDYLGVLLTSLSLPMKVAPFRVFEQTPGVVPFGFFEFVSSHFFKSYLLIHSVGDSRARWVNLPPGSHFKFWFDNQQGADIDVVYEADDPVSPSTMTVHWSGLLIDVYSGVLGETFSWKS